MDYQEFLHKKKHVGSDYGIDDFTVNSELFEYQKHVAIQAMKKGRYACFLDTGLGKTLIELVIAENFVKSTNKNVLIITPLAVAFQFVSEAKKFNIDDVSYCKDGNAKSKIVVCNYDRLHHFNSDDYDCVILDESSILKNFNGATKATITEFMKKVKYRYLFTATPSPNDYIELGTSSEALGYMGYMDMLSKFFKNNNNSIDIRHSGDEWYIKPHAENSFWQWVRTWSLSAKKPSDLGYSDVGFSLPKLHEIETIVANNSPLVVNDQHSLFNKQAQNFFEIKAEVKQTIIPRCEKAIEKLSDSDTGVYWVNLNDEAKFIRQNDSDAVEINGTMDVDKKEEILIAFSESKIKKLITKTSITAFGLNWQHCNKMTYFPTFSYEQYYQAVRRLWRFGQKREVFVDLVLSDGQSKVMKSLLTKKNKAQNMFEKLIEQTSHNYTDSIARFDNKIISPNFLKV